VVSAGDRGNLVEALLEFLAGNRTHSNEAESRRNSDHQQVRTVAAVVLIAGIDRSAVFLVAKPQPLGMVRRRDSQDRGRLRRARAACWAIPLRDQSKPVSTPLFR
jgi:hypothetical protein